MSKYSIYKSCFSVAIALILLTLFCMANTEPGSTPFMLCVFTLIIDIPFVVFVVVRMIISYRKNQALNEEITIAVKNKNQK